MCIYTQVPPSSENFGKIFPLSGSQFAYLYNGGLKEIKNKKACKAFCSKPDTQEAAIIVTAQSLPRAKIGSSVLRSPNQPSPYLSLALLPLPPSFSSLQLHPPPTSFLSRSHCLE